MEDKISKLIVKLVNKSNEPLETKQILKKTKEKFKNATHSKVLYRLMDLRGEGKIKGKHLDAGAKGVWIWWKKAAFKEK